MLLKMLLTFGLVVKQKGPVQPGLLVMIEGEIL